MKDLGSINQLLVDRIKHKTKQTKYSVISPEHSKEKELRDLVFEYTKNLGENIFEEKLEGTNVVPVEDPFKHIDLSKLYGGQLRSDLPGKLSVKIGEPGRVSVKIGEIEMEHFQFHHETTVQKLERMEAKIDELNGKVAEKDDVLESREAIIKEIEKTLSVLEKENKKLIAEVRASHPPIRLTKYSTLFVLIGGLSYITSYFFDINLINPLLAILVVFVSFAFFIMSKSLIRKELKK